MEFSESTKVTYNGFKITTLVKDGYLFAEAYDEKNPARNSSAFTVSCREDEGTFAQLLCKLKELTKGV